MLYHDNIIETGTQFYRLAHSRVARGTERDACAHWNGTGSGRRIARMRMENRPPARVAFLFVSVAAKYWSERGVGDESEPVSSEHGSGVLDRGVVGVVAGAVDGQHGCAWFDVEQRRFAW